MGDMKRYQLLDFFRVDRSSDDFYYVSIVFDSEDRKVLIVPVDHFAFTYQNELLNTLEGRLR